MLLTQEDAELFFELRWSLVFHVSPRLQIVLDILSLT